MRWYSHWYWRLVWGTLGVWVPAVVAYNVVLALNPSTHTLQDASTGLLALWLAGGLGMAGLVVALAASNPPARGRPFSPDGSNWPTEGDRAPEDG